VIEYPPSLVVEARPESEAALYETARKWIAGGDRAPGIHASDLLMPRKGYWRHKEPQELAEREVGIFLVGRVLHSFVLHEEATRPDLGATDEGSTYDEELRLWYSPDKEKDGKIIEVKTSRSLYEAKDVEDLDTYIPQVLIYLACRRLTEGEIWVLYINARDGEGRTAPAFRVFRVAIDPAHLPGLRKRIGAAVAALEVAISSDDFSALPLCPAWVCRPAYCAHWNKCQPDGRFDNPDYLAPKKRKRS
jgi:hypothetical protein